jgi:hypothetical protein
MTFFALTIMTSCRQTNNNRNATSNSQNGSFFLAYTFDGLGSNTGNKQPSITITGTKLIYTYEQKNFYGQESKNIDTALILAMRITSIDSIVNLIKDLGDTTIFESNPNIMSGGVHFLTITLGKDTVRYELMNTFDRGALKIMDIINPYLTRDKKVWVTETPN